MGSVGDFLCPRGWWWKFTDSCVAHHATNCTLLPCEASVRAFTVHAVPFPPSPCPPPLLQMVGKLRLRLSTLAPNQPVTATLPLLSERKKGAQQVGTAELSVRVEYGSTKALLRSYLRPHLPEAAYGAGVAEAGAQGAMAAETRRIVLRWLDAANPAIPRPVALAVLDTERCAAPGWGLQPGTASALALKSLPPLSHPLLTAFAPCADSLGRCCLSSLHALPVPV